MQKKKIINKNTKKIVKKIFGLDIKNESDLNKKIFDLGDSLKYIELLAELEKKFKNKLKNKQFDKILDINKLYNS